MYLWYVLLRIRFTVHADSVAESTMTVLLPSGQSAGIILSEASIRRHGVEGG
jgi:hypothetical protein